MNYKMMGRFISQILMLEALFMLPAGMISLCCGDWSVMWSFAVSMGAALLVSLLLYWLCKGAPSAFYAKEGLVCVGLSWIILSLFGCLPFYFSQEIPVFIDAFFETVSGFTTTGASVGPTCNFGGYNTFSKIILCLDMLLGRLEIFPILILFSHSTWKR